MQTKINCASEGKHPNGAACPYWNLEHLSCLWEQSCMYQLHAAIDQEDVVRSESVRTPELISQHLNMLRRGASRMSKLWDQEVFASLTRAMGILAKYDPNSVAFNLAALDSGEILQRDIVYVTALNTTVGVALGLANATAKRLELWRSQLKAEKYQTIRTSYMAGIRRGKLTEARLEMDIKADPEYRQAQTAVLEAEEQAEIFKNYSENVIEVVNALKKRIEALREERRYAGAAAGHT
jgi:hypothetical protein